MSPAEKQAQYGALKHEIELMKMRTNQDCANVLGSLTRILGISST
jgi:hypothetical protein